MISMDDVPVNDLIDQAAEKLKKMPELKAPEWAAFAKTGMHKERPPVREDWWHVRAAAVLKSVARLGPVGVSKLRTKYGGRKNRGHKPDRFYKGSGNILRKILQQLEKAQLVKKIDKQGRKGRIITGKGMSLLSQAAYEVSKMPPKIKVEKAMEPKPASQPRPEMKKPAEKPEMKQHQQKQAQPQKEEAKNE